MQRRLTELQAAIAAALNQTDALIAETADKPSGSVLLHDAGIGLEKAHLAIGQLIPAAQIAANSDHSVH